MVIKFLSLEGQSPSEIFKRLKFVYSGRLPSYPIVCRFEKKFRLGENHFKMSPVLKGQFPSFYSEMKLQYRNE